MHFRVIYAVFIRYNKGMERALRKPTAIGRLEPTARDLLILRAVHRFRFLTTSQAQMLTGSVSRNGLNDRLASLWAHDYLDRPVNLTRALFSHADTRHVVHVLGQRGADFLAKVDGIKFPKGKGWKSANADLSSIQNLGHTIGAVDTILQLDREISGAEGLRFIHHDELIANAVEWPKGVKKYHLPTQVRIKGKVEARGTNPDYTFGYGVFADGQERQALCFLEYDNDSEDLFRSNRKASSIAQKHECYNDAFERKLHTELYGYSNFRVLFVVNGGEDRVMKMKDVFIKKIGNARRAGVFLYTTKNELQSRGVFSDIWIDGAGNRKRLV
jgi:hypothetical protein